MTDSTELHNLLTPEALSDASTLRVTRTVVEEGEDSTGDPALFVWVLLSDDTAESDQTWDRLQPIAQRVKALLREHGESRWPYIRFQTESFFARRAG